MKQYNFFQKIISSFYSSDVYVYIGKEEIKKTGIRYLMLLIVLLWIPNIIKTQYSISSFITNELPSFVEKLPTIEIINGETKFDKECPILINDDKTGKPLFIFDNTGEYSSLENTTAKILITANSVLVKQSEFETRTYDLSNIKSFTLSPEDIIGWSHLGYYTFVFLILILLPMALCYRLFLALIYALFGLIFQSIIKINLSFQTLFRLSILAFTPAYVIDKVIGYFDLSFTGWSFVCFVMSCCFVAFGLLAIKQSEENPTEMNESNQLE